MPSSAGQRQLSVADCLSLSPLSAGTIVAGGGSVRERFVDWVAVIEWPVEDFVAAGELVLSTGVGCDAEMLGRMVAEIAAAGAAAVCVAVGDGAPFPELPAAVVEVGERTGVPIVALPWEVRFADVTRVVVDRLLSGRYADALDARGRLPADFTDALLQRDALGAIASALERMVGRPILVYDAGLALSAAGALARETLPAAALAAQPVAARALGPERLVELRALLDAADVQHLAAIPELVDGAVLVAPAHAEGDVVGYVVATGGGSRDEALVVERHALEQAAVATAIEMLRRRAAAEAEAAARGDFLWELANAQPADHARLMDKAVLLGYDVERRYRALVAVLERAAPAEADRALLEQLIYHLRRQGAAEGVQAVARGGRLLAVVPETAPPELAPARLAARLERTFGGGVVSWGTGDGAQALVDLADGVRRAEQAIAVGRALHGVAGVYDAEALAPFMLLHGLAMDAQARSEVERVLEPILDYDRRTSRELLLTLAVYLEEHGNTSSAARRLHLNRHSLLYRLRKIETLTGRSLERHEDRFLLDLSLRVHRMTAP